MDSTVVIEPAYNALSDVRALFEAYTAMLVTHDPAFQIYLDIQHYADELRAPAAEQLPSHGFDAELMPVYDTAEPVDIAQMPVRDTPETPVPRACPFDGGAV